MKTSRLDSILRAMAGQRVAVIGDLMLDRYVWGTAWRISQEAPVPIVSVTRKSETPGGAANVLHNLAKLGAKPMAFGVVGEDELAEHLSQLLTYDGVDTDAIVRDRSRRTTEKSRIMAGNQQVVRIDTEDTQPIGKGPTARLTQVFEEAVNAGRIDAVILEDYAKGVLTQDLAPTLCRIARAADILVALDPHPANRFTLDGITLATPNRTEAFAIAGEYDEGSTLAFEEDRALARVAQKLHDMWSAEHLLITLGAGGMGLFSQAGEPLHISTQAREVFDVSGAGDTVIATFTLAQLAGATLSEACEMANHAAGIVVAKVGAATV
ncbi:MAG: PfkB family carbohydrate kinase, partial [Candidatus Hydrogenedentes bacterium]|nr:PfkB family carbohydrate kinase [Candidatus Hydrogenedentota bacterium]